MTDTPMTPDGALAPWGRDEDGRPLLPAGAHWTDIPELVEQHLAGLQARVAQAQPGTWFVSPTAGVPGAVCTQYDGYTRTVGQFTNMLPGDLELALHAHSDLSWCLDLIAKLRAQVAELEASVCRCFDPTHHAPDCNRAQLTWQGITYNAANWYQDRDGEWLRPHSVNANGELLMNVRGDSAYEPVPVGEIEAEYGPLIEMTDTPDCEPWKPRPTGFPSLSGRERHDARVAAERLSIGPSEAAGVTEGQAGLDAMRAEHPAPCRVPDSPDCTCPVEYGIATDNEYGQRVLDPSPDLTESLARLARCQQMWPNSRLVQRTVRNGEWTEVTP